ncbi:MAG: ATP-binding protein [Armatimonadetes bacterium]|nr:ATP-binding protein [Armatimonadota bacterium]
MTASLLSGGLQELRIGSEFANGHQVRSFVREVARGASMGQEAMADLLLAVTEVFNNAVEHAHQFDAGREVAVRVHHLPHAIQVDVEDQGPGFAPGAATGVSPVLPTQRGLGLFLARQLVDDVTFERGAGTIVHLTKKLA